MDIIHEKADSNYKFATTAIEMIEGRSDDVLSLLNSSGEKVLVFPDFIRRAIVFSDENIINYSVTQKESHQINLFIRNIILQKRSVAFYMNVSVFVLIQQMTFQYSLFHQLIS